MEDHERLLKIDCVTFMEAPDFLRNCANPNYLSRSWFHIKCEEAGKMAYKYGINIIEL